MQFESYIRGVSRQPQINFNELQVLLPIFWVGGSDHSTHISSMRPEKAIRFSTGYRIHATYLTQAK